jgi:hypothetical protein
VSRWPDCGLVLPAAHERDGCRFRRVRATLELYIRDLTPQDERMARWLAGWDEPTISWVLSLVARSRAS